MRVNQKHKPALDVVEQVLAPAKLFIIARLTAQAVLKADHLPGRALQQAGTAQRNQRGDGLVLHCVPQGTAHALAQINHTVAGAAGDALAGGQRDLHRRAAVRAVKGLAFFTRGGLGLQPGELQLIQQHGAAA